MVGSSSKMLSGSCVPLDYLILDTVPSTMGVEKLSGHDMILPWLHDHFSIAIFGGKESKETHNGVLF